MNHVEPPCAEWKRLWSPASNYLTHKRGLNFITIIDNRPNLESSMFFFERREAEIYLECDAGTSAIQIWKKMRDGGDASLSPGEIEDFLDELVEARLMFKENGVYLSLAIPFNNHHHDEA